MPILLEEAWNPGNRDKGNTYPEAQIIYLSVRPEGHIIEAVIEYGETVSGEWIPGSATIQETFSFREEDYNELVGCQTTSGENHMIYAGAKRVVYEKILADGLLVGSII